jgi:hypothetical protein
MMEAVADISMIPSGASTPFALIWGPPTWYLNEFQS